MIYKKINTPVGTLRIHGENNMLSAIEWQNEKRNIKHLSKSVECYTDEFLNKVESQIQEYFQGKRTTFSVELNPVGTDFQKRVWKALEGIPFGTTKSYGEIACEIGSPKASRAVGVANSKNPLSIVIPCHRVIGANGKLTGFAGGVDVKEKLLNLEESI